MCVGVAFVNVCAAIFRPIRHVTYCKDSKLTLKKISLHRCACFDTNSTTGKKLIHMSSSKILKFLLNIFFYLRSDIFALLVFMLPLPDRHSHSNDPLVLTHVVVVPAQLCPPF